MKLRMTLAAAALVTIGLSSATVYADSLTFTLTNSNENVPISGGSATYAATVSAPASNGAAVFLNGDSFNVTAPVTLDDSDFFNNFPLSLAPGASFKGNLFVLTLPHNSPFEIQSGTFTFLGTFTLQGGANGSANNSLDTVNFSLTTTPEPSSIVLLLIGMVGLATAFLWRFKRVPAVGYVSRFE